MFAERSHDHAPVEVLPETAAPPPVAEALPEGAGADCRQTREFQTKIVIDGQVVPAYGTACLMPDGSWRQLGVSP